MHINVHTQDSTIYISADSGQSLAEAIWLSGKLSPLPLCSGLGRCGQCKVLFNSPAPKPHAMELKLLSASDIERGIRLACRHILESLNPNPAGNIEITLHSNSIPEQNIEVSTSEKSALLAVDLGTTSLHWQALSTTGNIIAKGQQINPQMGAGSDIVSRLAFAMKPEGTKILSDLVVNSLINITKNLPPVTEICLAANTAMSGIFLQKNIKSLAAAPYSLPLHGNNIEYVKGLAPIYIPVQLAPFVGGDISAGYASLMQQNKVEFPFIFTDLGTNGEFILSLNEQDAYITSVPLGPALEGIGLSLGHMAHGTSGVVCEVHLSPKGLEPTTLDNAPPKRICGTGYLSILKCLFQCGIIQQDGHFTHKENLNNPLAANLFKLIEKQDNEYILRLWPHLADNMFISSTDIEEILKVKAAFTLAMHELLNTANLLQKDLKNIYLAGAMGSHVKGEDLEALGFIGYGMSNRLIKLGNSSLDGAKTLLIDPTRRSWLHEWSKNNKHIQLANRADFLTKYMQHMQFTFTS